MSSIHLHAQKCHNNESWGTIYMCAPMNYLTIWSETYLSSVILGGRKSETKSCLLERRNLLVPLITVIKQIPSSCTMTANSAVNLFSHSKIAKKSEYSCTQRTRKWCVLEKIKYNPDIMLEKARHSFHIMTKCIRKYKK